MRQIWLSAPIRQIQKKWKQMSLDFGGHVIIRYHSHLKKIFKRRFVQSRVGAEIKTERVLIVGAGDSGQEIAFKLDQHEAETAYKIAGFVDDDPHKFSMYIAGVPVLGTTSNLFAIIEQAKIDLIIIAVQNIDDLRLQYILEECRKTKARIKLMSDMVEFMSSKDKHYQFLQDVQPEQLIGQSLIKSYEDIDLSSISKRVVLVTGAAGSIGSELCHQILHLEPIELILLDLNESALHDLEIELRSKYPNAKITPALADITHYADIRTIFNRYKPQLVYHAAAYKHVPMLEKFPNEAIRVNLAGTLNVAEQAIVNASERFVLISTDKAVNPTSVMGASKRLCELIIHCISLREDHNTLFTAVRFGNVLGSRGSVVPTFERQIQNGGPVTVTHKDMTRYFMSIVEAVNLVIHASAMTKGDDIFIFRMGEKVRILDIAERMIRFRGLRPYDDIKIDFIGIRDGEKLHEELLAPYEKPLDTYHPKVVTLNKWLMNGSAETFIESISNLIYNGIPQGENALEHFLVLCAKGEEEYSRID